MKTKMNYEDVIGLTVQDILVKADDEQWPYKKVQCVLHIKKIICIEDQCFILRDIADAMVRLK